ncbi:MAG: hypothetical protein U0990_09220 [Candidatus Nanopelagicales bacterium]|nr:hypothetical protein [Candidatus Nanopelagicales bacterium]MDZ4250254.1 hypothetical protein [Candidatus Nanopelagicales bacterium]
MRVPGIPILAVVVAGSLLASPVAVQASPAVQADSSGGTVSPSSSHRDVPAGYDLYETDGQDTYIFMQGASEIPAGYFSPTSLPFSGSVKLCGEPLETVPHLGDVGDADTVVQRLSDMTFGSGSTTTVPIEMVELNLVSCEPIKVENATTTKKWNLKVELSPTTPSTGAMTVSLNGLLGGTFMTQLQLFATIIFTRVGSDTKSRMMDVSDHLQGSTSSPWRSGCKLPALAVPGVNDGFCPGLTTKSKKRAIELAGATIQQTVVPAQPRLEHFTCYGADQARTKFKPRSVRFKDQFGKRRGRLLRPSDLCNPAKKNSEPWLQKRVHLKCYAFEGRKFRPRTAVTRDQFGSRTLRVKEPEKVCVPSKKQLLKPSKKITIGGKPNPLLVDNFVCYRVEPRGASPARSVRLKDQFGHFRTRVLKPVGLCNPAKVDGVASNHAIKHLTCYRLDPKRPAAFKRRLVQVSNRYGREALSVRLPRELCAPGSKVLPPKSG